MFSSALKKQLAPVLQEGFVIKRAVFQPCLRVVSYERVECNDGEDWEVESIC